MAYFQMNLFFFVTLFSSWLLLCDCSSKIAVTGISLSSGLTSQQKEALLDEHNRLRSLQAQGKVPGQPQAADMTRLEWSDETAQHAQVWADKCLNLRHGNAKRYGDGQNLALNSNRGNLLKGGMTGWFYGEFPQYTYGSPPGYAGHYTQIVTSYSLKLGCGANKCPQSTYGHLVCNFFVGGNMAGKPPFKRGRACTKCPVGYGFCKDSLCTSSRVCSSSDRSCVCKVDRNECAKHGTFVAGSCECRCKAGYTGLNCQETCKDHPYKGCSMRKKRGECQPSKSNIYFVDTYLNCKASCGMCKAAEPKPKPTNNGGGNRGSGNGFGKTNGWSSNLNKGSGNKWPGQQGGKTYTWSWNSNSNNRGSTSDSDEYYGDSDSEYY